MNEGVNMSLSKSKYCEGIQCNKLLWLEINKQEEKDDLNNESVFETGNEVGALAKNLFGKYQDIPFNKDLNQMIKDTEKVIKDNKSVNITEASFVYNNNFCSVDILRKNNNNYEIYEVKSSTNLKDIYIEDASYQYYVLTMLNYNVTKVSIVHINSNYIRKDELDLDKLFTIVDITDKCKERINYVKEKIIDINKCLDNKEEPEDSIDFHCMNPYPCPFFNYCTRNLSKPNVFSIAGMSFKDKIKFYNKELYKYEDLLKEDINWKYKEQIEYTLNNKIDKIEKNNIKDFLSTLTYPLYYLDFETFQQAIPKYKGIKPYEQIPFQYSLHYKNSVCDKLNHLEYLAEEDVDPRRKLAERLVKDIPKDVCVLAYNMSFEKTVIKNLAETFPDLREHLLNIRENIKDLMVPFYNRNYYTKEMNGSYSIKYVLPALFPNDEALNYHNLDEVHNGSEAMNAYAKLSTLDEKEKQKLRNNLLKYCELDTLAMVKIHEKLMEVVD